MRRRDRLVTKMAAELVRMAEMLAAAEARAGVLAERNEWMRLALADADVPLLRLVSGCEERAKRSAAAR